MMRDRNSIHNQLSSLFPRILVHEVPYWKRVKSIRTHRWRPVLGIVMIAGQVRPWRESSGTQNRSPSGPWTQPLESSSWAGIGTPEKTFRGIAGSFNSEGPLALSGRNEHTSRSNFYGNKTHLSPCFLAHSKFGSCRRQSER
jgi:hypothetical protein